MGWSFGHATHYKANGTVDRKAECDSLFDKNCTVLKSSMKGTVYYCALKVPDGNVIGYIVLTTGKDRYDPYYNFGYKGMSEDCHPSYYDCPKGILNLLTPTDSESANQWRTKCREKQMAGNWLKKLPIGEKVIWREEKVLVKHAPAYQFKTWFWYNEADGGYIPKTHVTELNSRPYKEEVTL